MADSEAPPLPVSEPVGSAPNSKPAPLQEAKTRALNAIGSLRKQSSIVLERAKSSISEATRKVLPEGDVPNGDAAASAGGAGPKADAEPKPPMLNTLRRQASQLGEKVDAVPGVPLVKSHWQADSFKFLKLCLFGFSVSVLRPPGTRCGAPARGGAP